MASVITPEPPSLIDLPVLPEGELGSCNQEPSFERETAMKWFLRYLREHHLALVALFIALGGTSYAAVTGIPGRNGVVHGCFKRRAARSASSEPARAASTASAR